MRNFQPGRLASVMTFIVCLLASTGAAAQNAAQGSITVNGKKFEFHHAYAVKQPSAVNGSPETVVVITDKSLAPAVFADRNARRQEAQARGVKMMEVAVDKRPDDVTSIFILVDTMRTTSSTRRHKVELQTSSDRLLKGRVWMEAPWENFDDKYLIDVRFESALVAGK